MTALRSAQQKITSSDGSQSQQGASLQVMPLDVLHLVADHLNATDLVALTKASKQLQDLLSDPGIWKKLYKKTAYFLPPGPYDWQSTSYLINALLRAEKIHSMWPSSSSCPEIHRTRTLTFGYDATFSVLLGRWLLVAEGSTLVCHDLQCDHIHTLASAKILFDEEAGRRIFRVFSVGSVQEGGILAFAVLVFKDSFTISKVVMDRGEPSELQTVFASKQILVSGWTYLVDVRLYHRLLVVNIGGCSSDWGSSERLVLIDIDTLRRYHIPASTDDAAFDPIHIVTFFFATRTHLVKVIESSHGYSVQFKLECFPLSAAYETSEGVVLQPSHQSRVVYGPRLRQCTVVYESPIDSETGRLSFAVCGLNTSSYGGKLEITEVHLEPDGSISFLAFGLTGYLVSSFCIGLSGQHGYGVALSMTKQPLVFSLDYCGPESFLFRYSMLDCKFPESELVASDDFGGMMFFSRRSCDHTLVETVDFVRDGAKVEGRMPICVTDSQSKMKCKCNECRISGGRETN